jgi:tRNA(Ser,Leu) C12 N-acetylase TAN1
MGMAVVNTLLDNREVITRCRTLWEAEPLDSFEFAIKWVPVDYWCTTELTAIKELIDIRIKPRIGKHQTWGMRVHKRRWQQYHTRDIIECLAAGIDRRVDLGHPDWIIWVDVVGRQTAVSLLKPQDVFSIRVQP